VKILTVDIGTGTQDIFLFDSRLDLENGYKLVLPSPTMMVHRQIRAATAARESVVLVGRQMGGGPSAWAAAEHARAGLPIYATPDAALTIDDDLERVLELGIRVIGEDEAAGLSDEVRRVELCDLDMQGIRTAFKSFGVSLGDLGAVAAAVFDHGTAPPDVSDRRFRFDYLDGRIRDRNSLSSFAYLAQDVPQIMSRMRTVARVANDLDCPLIVMDTAPAAIMGARLDSRVGQRGQRMIANIGNFHALAFRLSDDSIEGVFEHHTGEIDAEQLRQLLLRLADGSLKNSEVFEDMGHGALVYSSDPLLLGVGEYDVVVTGPRRSMLPVLPNRLGATAAGSRLRPYFAVPFGDMMLAGCFGLLAATADLLPSQGEVIRASLDPSLGTAIAPWDVE
jgi:uncharacterized protein (DUF1786 family)